MMNVESDIIQNNSGEEEEDIDENDKYCFITQYFFLIMIFRELLYNESFQDGL